MFGGFLTALAVLRAGQDDAAEVQRTLTDEEKILAVPLATAQPERDYTNSLGMKMLCIAPGRFSGTNPLATDWKKWDKVVEPYWMAETEVSVSQYFAFVSDQPGDKSATAPEWLHADKPTFVDREGSPYHQVAAPIYQNGMPITGITHAQMQKFCDWLSARPGEIMRYRLPTREEWVCAYRAGTERAYPWGETFQPGQCNTAIGNTKPPALELTKTFSANSWKLYHIAGNVAEVLLDGQSAAGGHWKTTQPEHHQATAILPFTQDLWLYGFRVVAVPK
jgi:formylglycine-generating enzyme required for sulfatase activity